MAIFKWLNIVSASAFVNGNNIITAKNCMKHGSSCDLLFSKYLTRGARVLSLSWHKQFTHTV